MKNMIPLLEWCSKGGLSLISFDTNAEYTALKHILDSLSEKKIILIHSKPIRDELTSNITLIDATSHTLTESAVISSQLGEEKGPFVIDTPADIRVFLGRFQKLTNTFKDTDFWVWWSPSDLITHGIEEKEIARCLRIFSKDYSTLNVLVLIAKNIHTPQGFAILEYITEKHFAFTRSNIADRDAYSCKILKHPDMQMEGEVVEL